MRLVPSGLHLVLHAVWKPVKSTYSDSDHSQITLLWKLRVERPHNGPQPGAVSCPQATRVAPRVSESLMAPSVRITGEANASFYCSLSP